MRLGNTPHGLPVGTPERRRDVSCGLVGLCVVAALFLTQYPAIVALADGSLGILASTAIVWVFITAWLVLWIGMEVALARLSRNGAAG